MNTKYIISGAALVVFGFLFGILYTHKKEPMSAGVQPVSSPTESKTTTTSTSTAYIPVQYEQVGNDVPLGRDRTRISAAGQILLAAELFYDANHRYPKNMSEIPRESLTVKIMGKEVYYRYDPLTNKEYDYRLLSPTEDAVCLSLETIPPGCFNVGNLPAMPLPPEKKN